MGNSVWIEAKSAVSRGHGCEICRADAFEASFTAVPSLSARRALRPVVSRRVSKHPLMCQMSYNEVKRILSGFDEIARIAEDIRSHKEARRRVVSQPFLAQAVLPHAFAAFAEAHPGLRYSLEIRSRGDVGSWIAG